jgi:uncharacterized membrane protein YbaN (DUF454 family)
MMRIVVRLVGFLFLALGVVGILTPIPFGVIFLMLSFLLLIPTTPQVARHIKSFRRWSPRFDRLMHRATTQLPAPYRRILRETAIDILER